MGFLEESEFEALKYAQVPQVPEKATEDTPVWIYAIAKVLTYTLSEAYIIVKNSYGGDPEIIKTFCPGGVARVLSVHPYKFLDTSYVPKLSGEADTRAFLAKIYGVDRSEVNKLKKAALLKLLYCWCMKKQLEDEAEKKEIALARAEADALREKEQEIRNSE